MQIIETWFSCMLNATLSHYVYILLPNIIQCIASQLTYLFVNNNFQQSKLLLSVAFWWQSFRWFSIDLFLLFFMGENFHSTSHSTHMAFSIMAKSPTNFFYNLITHHEYFIHFFSHRHLLKERFAIIIIKNHVKLLEEGNRWRSLCKK